MTHRLLLFVFTCLILGPLPVYASLSQDEYEHARNAFTFAERNKWDDALLHARATHDPVLIKLIEWEYLLDSDSHATFAEITQFIRDNPGWPEQKKLRLRAEQSLRDGNVGDTDVLAWFSQDTPISGVGKIALADALKHFGKAPPDKIAALVRDAWINGDFDEAQEKTILANYGSLLHKEDDIARIDRLLWEEKNAEAKRILGRVSEAQQKLYKARMLLIDDKKTASLAINQIPSALKNDPGLIYDRMRFRARRGDDKGVREMLLAAPKNSPYPDKWWHYREQQIRIAIDEKNYAIAGKLLANHGQEDGTGVADAVWLQGWLELEFLQHPKTAYQIFYGMYSKVHFPVSKARAALWAARAAEKSGDSTAANGWYNTASAFPTTFYGQLGAYKQYGTAPLHIPATPEIGSDARNRFEALELVQAVKLCALLDASDLAERLISYLIETASSDETIALAAELGNQVNKTYLSVRGAKKALQQQNVVLLNIGYPTVKIPDAADIENPLALAIVRQESEFDPSAKSPSGAVGLMQLRPSTAKENARKMETAYHRDQLMDPDYNIKLGSHYLSRLINSYDGSYVMAIAAYNAGPGNVHDWVKKFGTPGNSVDGALMWIEKIPFAETRNYVQRVMENLEVYRYIESDGGSAKLQIADDLMK